MHDAKTVSIEEENESAVACPVPSVPALVIAWSSAEPQRVGEVALLEGKAPRVLGRGGAQDDEARVAFVRQRPGANEDAPPLGGLALSRRQLVLRVTAGGIEVERVGRCEVRIDGAACERGALTPGATLLIKGQLLLLCVERTRTLAPLRHFPARELGAFGQPDATGMLGESEPVWALRERLGFIAQAGAHALLLGASGTGKELAAHAIHALSARRDRPLVARNAATIPATLIDAELFGNAKNYPNPGMSDRPGLIGQANGGTLFLDEIAELAQDLQAHLLRVLDAHGEYQRLGEGTTRSSDFRLIGATNRDESALKHDVLARLTLRARLPTLEERRDDVPLLVQHLLLRAAAKSPTVAERFVGDHDGRAFARVDPALLEHLLARSYAANLRDLDGVLWRAMAGSPGDAVALTDEVRAEAAAVEPARATRELTASEVRDVVEREKGNVEHAAKQLGLKNRFALYRVMKKLGVDARGEGEPE